MSQTVSSPPDPTASFQYLIAQVRARTALSPSDYWSPGMSLDSWPTQNMVSVSR